MAGLDALDADAETQPPDGELAQAIEGMGAGEGDAVFAFQARVAFEPVDAAPTVGAYLYSMRVIAISTLRRFWQKHPMAEIPLRAWYAEARRARWERPADVKADRRNVSIVANNRVVFNIKGNDYRLVVAMRYDKQIMLIRFIGTHAEYDRIDATTV